MRVKGAILCGGEGRRLRPLTYYFQKTMIPIGKKQKPILEYIVRLFNYHGIKDISLLVGYKHEQVMNYFGDGSRFGVNIDYVHDPEDKKGSGHALLNAFNKGVFKGYDLIVIYYGDILSNIDLSKLISHHRNSDADVVLAVSTKYNIPVGIVELNRDNVVDMIEKPNLNLNVTIRILTFSTKLYEELEFLGSTKKELDIMEDVIPYLIRRRYKIKSYKHKSFWYDVGATDKYEKLDNELIENIFKNILDIET